VTEFHRTAAWRALATRVRKRTQLPAECVGCHGTIWPGEPYDVGHILDRYAYPELALNESNVGPQHRGENRRAGGRAGAHKTNSQRARRTKGEFPEW
jgi:hypothetical protein